MTGLQAKAEAAADADDDTPEDDGHWDGMLLDWLFKRAASPEGEGV